MSQALNKIKLTEHNNQTNAKNVELTSSEIKNAIHLTRGSSLLFQAPDGRLLDLPSNVAADVLEWNKEQHFSVLTWNERIILGFIQTIRAFSQQWITHLLLVIVLFIYTAIGGIMFHYVEGPYEINVKRNLDDARFKLSRKVWLSCKLKDEADWYKTFGEEIRMFEQEIISMPTAVNPERKWDYFGSLFFSGTVYTTIGYGNVVPSTDYGRALTILYAFVGIPLVLIILADLGKMLTRTIKYMWSFVRRFYYARRFALLRKAIYRFCCRKRRRGIRDSEVKKELKPFDVDDNFDLPVSIALFLLLVYILLGGVLLREWERDWSYFHAVYFIFVSLTTIGFGDMVSTNPTYLLITFVYLIIGLALTSMCINVIQVSIANTFTNAKTKLALRIGMSASTLKSRSNTSKRQMEQEREM